MAIPQDAVILIPSLRPDEKLGEYARNLAAAGFTRVVVVDDGSGPEYKGRFDEIRSLPQVTVLGYPENHGKGYALRHGMRHILGAFADAPGIVTADSDGQHTAEDCLKVCEAMLLSPGKLIIGSRDFSQKDVPAKSRAGNRLTSFFFAVLYGRWLPDTQTGLRGIPMDALPQVAGIPGDRYEYEMNMLIHWAGWKREFGLVPIRTIYEDNNKGSHFRAFRDSARIYRLLLGNFARFASSSAMSSLLDVGLFTLLDKWVIPAAFPALAARWDYGAVLAATAVARVASSLFNFHLNRQFVFQLGSSKGALTRYVILAAFALAVSAALVSLLNTWLGMDRTVAKILVDVMLFFVNYRLQKAWVFPPQAERNVNA